MIVIILISIMVFIAGIICGSYVVIKGKEILVNNNILNAKITEVNKDKAVILSSCTTKLKELD